MEYFYQTLNNLGYTHPVHPTMVYLPIGCVMAAFIFGITAVLFNRPGLSTSAKHCMTLALVAVFPTIFFGYMDWQHFHGGNWIFPIKMKIILAALLLVLLSFTALCNWKYSEKRKAILALYTLCFLTVVAIGYYGGEIVFARFGPGQKASETGIEEKGLPPEETVTYADVSDIFNQICILCHKGPRAPFGLQLDSYDHIMKGSRNGKVVIPGNPGESELVRRIRGQSQPAMPFMQDPLPENKIESLVRWIKDGAKKGDISQ